MPHAIAPVVALAPVVAAGRSWITDAGRLLDSAAMQPSAVDLPRGPAAAPCLRSGSDRSLTDQLRLLRRAAQAAKGRA